MAASGLRELTDRDRAIIGKYAARQGSVRGLDQTIADDAGNISWPLLRVPLLRRLEHRGVLSAEQARAGERFHDLFQRSGLDALRAADMGRAPIAGAPRFGELTPSGERCRHRVAEAIAALGGHGSIASSAVWHVVGLEWPVARWAQTMQRRPDQATGILIGALAMLVGHFGGRPAAKLLPK